MTMPNQPQPLQAPGAMPPTVSPQEVTQSVLSAARAGVNIGSEAQLQAIAEAIEKLFADGIIITSGASNPVTVNNDITLTTTLVIHNFQEDEFTVVIASPAEVAFTLTQPFVPGGISMIFVNGVAFAEGTDYTISGTSLVWLETDFELDPGDKIIAKYTFSTTSLWQEDEFTPTAAQTVFTLSQTARAGFSVLFVNGIGFAEGTDYTISGTTLTWLDTDFVLATTDELIVKYERL